MTRNARTTLPADPAPGDNPDAITLAHYAERAYLEYTLSVVKGRALPDVCDGAQPVQRHILYAMQRMGLGLGLGLGVGHNGPGAAGIPKPVKRARVAGGVLGRIHPHSDQAAYDALNARAQALYLSEGFVEKGRLRGGVRLTGNNADGLTA